MHFVGALVIGEGVTFALLYTHDLVYVLVSTKIDCYSLHQPRNEKAQKMSALLKLWLSEFFVDL